MHRGLERRRDSVPMRMMLSQWLLLSDTDIRKRWLSNFTMNQNDLEDLVKQISWPQSSASD